MVFIINYIAKMQNFTNLVKFSKNTIIRINLVFR